jgi:hypothetical protein
MFCEFRPDFLLVANEDDLHIGKITERLNSSRHGILRGMIPSHCVEGNFHPGKSDPRNYSAPMVRTWRLL